MDWSRESTLPRQAGELLDRYSLSATEHILGKARDFARRTRRNCWSSCLTLAECSLRCATTGTRYDQQIVDYLTKEKFDFFDMNDVHLRDFKNYRLSFDDYMKLYFIGHYNPRGNHFFAYSIKDKVVEWLDPKPITYQKRDPQTIDFRGYLVDYH